MPIWIFQFIRKYWKVLLILLALGGAYLYFQHTSDGWAKRYEQIEQSHQTEIKQIQKARDDERAQHEANVKQLQDEMELVRQQYDERIKQLETKKKTIAKEIVEQHGNDPAALAQQLSNVTGFRVKKVGEK